jgi:hypothetical protein
MNTSSYQRSARTNAVARAMASLSLLALLLVFSPAARADPPVALSGHFTLPVKPIGLSPPAATAPQHEGVAVRTSAPLAPPASPIRVTQTVRGLYDAIPEKLPSHWSAEERVSPGARSITLRHDGGGEALFNRSYDEGSKTLSLGMAYVDWKSYPNGIHDGAVPRWIEAPVPLVEGKGVPTVVYVTLRQMKQMGIPYGGLKVIDAHNVKNSDSYLNIPDMAKRGLSTEEAVRETSTYKYMETIAMQSGHKVVGVSYEIREYNGERPNRNPVESHAAWQGKWLALRALKLDLQPVAQADTVAPAKGPAVGARPPPGSQALGVSAAAP